MNMLAGVMLDRSGVSLTSGAPLPLRTRCGVPRPLLPVRLPNLENGQIDAVGNVS